MHILKTGKLKLDVTDLLNIYITIKDFICNMSFRVVKFDLLTNLLSYKT